MAEIPSGYNPNSQFQLNPEQLSNLYLPLHPVPRPAGIYNAEPSTETSFTRPLTELTKPYNIDEGVLGKFFGMSADRAISPILTSALETVGSAYGEKLGKEGMEIILKNVSKMVPLVGAATSAKAAYDMAQISENALTPEARFLATYATKLNAADAALSAAEPFVAGLGVPILADIALGTAEMVMELEITSIEKDAAKGNYLPTDGQHAAIGAIALSNPFSGIPNLVKEFGVKDSIGIMGTTAKEGLKILMPKSIENFFFDN